MRPEQAACGVVGGDAITLVTLKATASSMPSSTPTITSFLAFDIGISFLASSYLDGSLFHCSQPTLTRRTARMPLELFQWKRQKKNREIAVF